MNGEGYVEAASPPKSAAALLDRFKYICFCILFSYYFFRRGSFSSSQPNPPPSNPNNYVRRKSSAIEPSSKWPSSPEASPAPPLTERDLSTPSYYEDSVVSTYLPAKR